MCNRVYLYCLLFILSSQVKLPADETAVYEGSITINQSTTQKHSTFEFIYVVTPETSLMGFQSSPEGTAPSVTAYLNYKDTRNPFEVLVQIDRPNSQFVAKFSGKEKVVSVQENTNGRYPMILDETLLGLVGRYQQLGISSRSELLNPEGDHPLFSSIAIDGRPERCNGFRILQNPDSQLTITAPKKLADYPFRGEKDRGTYESVATSVKFDAPLNLLSSEAGNFTLSIESVSTLGQSHVKTLKLSKLKRIRSQAAATKCIDDFYKILGTGRKVISQSNVELALDNGLVMVATNKDVDGRILASSFLAKAQGKPSMGYAKYCILIIALLVSRLLDKRFSK